MPPPLLAVEGLTKKYLMGDTVVTAVDSVSLSFLPGEMTAIVGRSGSGKSTLLNLLGGLDRPTSGEILADGVRMAERDEDELALYRRRTVGFIFQFFNLVPTLTARGNVELPLVFAEVPPAERRRRADELLGLVGLSGRAEHRPSELSGGEQQRVAVARALANGAPVLLADEPTGNLDTKTAGDVMELLRTLNRERKLTVLLVTHDRGLAQSHCGRVIEMSDGKVLSDTKATP
jgi:ABC-type lipoprotein export system ATPase subunit